MDFDDLSPAGRADIERATVASARLQVLRQAAAILGRDAVVERVHQVVDEGTLSLHDVAARLGWTPSKDK